MRSVAGVLPTRPPGLQFREAFASTELGHAASSPHPPDSAFDARLVSDLSLLRAHRVGGIVAGGRQEITANCLRQAAAQPHMDCTAEAPALRSHYDYHPGADDRPPPPQPAEVRPRQLPAVSVLGGSAESGLARIRIGGLVR